MDGRRPRRKGRVVLALVTLALAGCTAGKPILWVEKDVSLAKYRTVHVTGVVNETGKTFDFDVARAIEDKIRSKLVERGVALTELERPLADTLVLQAALTAYSPGNAAARWALPGAGATECIVKGGLVDGQTGTQVGVLLSHRSVSSGGLFTVGADTRILDVVATDIADAVADALRRQ